MTLKTFQRAARLPAPQPGVVVTIPLADWPAYKELRGLEAMDRTEVAKLEERTGTRKAPGVCWVKRTDGTTDEKE